MSKNEAVAEIRDALAALQAERGYVLPHRGLLAAALPELHGAYATMYRALTVDERHMTPLARECVWLAILVACDEPVGTHHVAAFRRCGGSDREAAALFQQTAWAMGVDATGFLRGEWAPHFPAFDPAAAYLEGTTALNAAGDLPDETARLARLAVHAARGRLWALEVELEAAYRAGVDERRMAEAISLIIWPRGVNPFVRAAETWLGLLRSGRVSPSPAFAAWAAVDDQGPLVLGGEGAPAPQR